MSNKNPFEIRTEILAMAKEYLDQQQNLNMSFAINAFEYAVSQGKVTADQWQQYVPASYTMDELMKKAQEMYGFVSKKD
jgi:hypothetical protein